jgi:hypothetical protein
MTYLEQLIIFLKKIFLFFLIHYILTTCITSLLLYYFPLKELGDCYGLMTLNFIFEDNKIKEDWIEKRTSRRTIIEYIYHMKQTLPFKKHFFLHHMLRK